MASTSTTPLMSQKEDKKTMTDKVNSSYIAVVVDRSGSMSSMGSEVVGGFNAFIEKQIIEEGECHATIVRFDNEVEILKHGINLQEIEPADETTFLPRGMTALYDAIYQTTKAVEKKVEELKPDKVIVMILTDGYENSSEVKGSLVKEEIKKKTTEGWEFVYVGANQDAIMTGTNMGFESKRCMTFGVQKSDETWKALSNNLTRARTGPAAIPSSGFTQMERQSSAPSESYGSVREGGHSSSSPPPPPSSFRRF